jgi:predicted lactoylglutathione lyase
VSALKTVTLEVPDPGTAEAFYDKAFGPSVRVDVRSSDAPTTGFRGFTISLVVSQPNIVDGFIASAIDAGATTLKPAAKSFWGYGGVVQAPDGAIWKVASSSKKNTGPATRDVEDVVLLIGVADVKASKRFYIERGMSVKKSFGSKYVEFDAAGSPLKLALYGRPALAKDAGVDARGTGSHRIVLGGDATAVTDADGFVWENV